MTSERGDDQSLCGLVGSLAKGTCSSWCLGRELHELAACKHEEEGREAYMGKNLCEAWVMQEGRVPCEQATRGREKRRRASGLLGDHWAFARETDLAWEKETVQANGPGLAI